MNKRLFIQSHAKHEVESIETVLNRNLNINISGTEFYTVLTKAAWIYLLMGY